MITVRAKGRLLRSRDALALLAFLLLSSAAYVARNANGLQLPTRVLRLEHLLAIMLQTNRPKDRQRASMLAGEAAFDAPLLETILDRYQLTAVWEKIRSPA